MADAQELGDFSAARVPPPQPFRQLFDAAVRDVYDLPLGSGIEREVDGSDMEALAAAAFRFMPFLSYRPSWFHMVQHYRSGKKGPAQQHPAFKLLAGMVEANRQAAQCHNDWDEILDGGVSKTLNDYVLSDIRVLLMRFQTMSVFAVLYHADQLADLVPLLKQANLCGFLARTPVPGNFPAHPLRVQRWYCEMIRGNQLYADPVPAALRTPQATPGGTAAPSPDLRARPPATSIAGNLPSRGSTASPGPSPMFNPNAAFTPAGTMAASTPASSVTLSGSKEPKDPTPFTGAWHDFNMEYLALQQPVMAQQEAGGPGSDSDHEDLVSKAMGPIIERLSFLERRHKEDKETIEKLRSDLAVFQINQAPAHSPSYAAPQAQPAPYPASHPIRRAQEAHRLLGEMAGMDAQLKHLRPDSHEYFRISREKLVLMRQLYQIQRAPRPYPSDF